MDEKKVDPINLKIYSDFVNTAYFRFTSMCAD